MYKNIKATEDQVLPNNEIGLAQISKPEYMIQLGDKQFGVPVKSGLGKTGNEFRFNETGILLYAGKDTEGYIEKIAKRIGLKDLAKIVFPTKEETEKMYNDLSFRKALIAKYIYWIPFVVDEKDENRSVSLKEYRENPDNFRFCTRNIYYGDWHVNFPENINFDSIAFAMGLGGLK